jgi:hypothetical protein
VGIVIPEQDMPFTESGIRPDIIINPHAIPSRMTIGQLLETVMGKACSIYGAFGECTAFVNKGSKYQIFGKLLVEQGFHSSGNEILYDGQTGKQLEADIFFGPTYYMRLKHMVKDKINYRARGPNTVLTRQPVQGRANDGGLRIGEMERDGLIAHGITHFMQESMLVRGDDYYIAICNKTGTIAIYNSNRNLFLSPFVDGPIKFIESLDTNTLNIENISCYGRSFSIVRVPYAFKLLYQELQTMNVQMRVITEQNIDQLAPLSFTSGKNISNKFLFSPAPIETAPIETAPIETATTAASNQAAALSSAVSDQAAALSSAVSDQAAALSSAASNQAAVVSSAVSNQVAALSSAASNQVAVVSSAVSNQVAALSKQTTDISTTIAGSVNEGISNLKSYVGIETSTPLLTTIAGDAKEEEKIEETKTIKSIKI